MALKKQDHKDNAGLNGAWNAVSKKHDGTKNSYLDAVKGGAIAGGILLGLNAAVQVSVISGMDILTHGGEYDYYDTAITEDKTFEQDHNYYGVDTGRSDLLLVGDMRTWRLYKAEDHEEGGREFTYVHDTNEVLRLLNNSLSRLEYERDTFLRGDYTTPSELYEVSNISGVYEQDDEFKRYAHYTNEARAYGNLEDRYNTVIGQYKRAIRDVENEASSMYGFVEDSTPVKYLDESPFFEWHDVGEKWQYVGASMKENKELALILLGLFGGAFGTLGAFDERAKRRKLEELKPKKDKNSIPRP